MRLDIQGRQKGFLFFWEKLKEFFFCNNFVFKELVAGQYESELYTVHGLTLESRKRREHLSLDDLQKNKALLESFTKGGNVQNLDQNGVVSVAILLVYFVFFFMAWIVFSELAALIVVGNINYFFSSFARNNVNYNMSPMVFSC